MSEARGYFGVGLMHPKSEVNMGSALRACGNFGAAFMAVQGKRFKRSATDTMKIWRHLPVIETLSMHSIIPYDCVPVAVELTPASKSLVTFYHPERALYLFGPEDGDLGKDTLSWCREVIYIPTDRCMNLAACVSVVLYDRMVKRGTHG